MLIAGRRQALLDEITAAHSGMAALALGIESPNAIKAFAAHVSKDFPSLLEPRRAAKLEAGKCTDLTG